MRSRPTAPACCRAADDKTIKLWDAATGALLRTFEGHSGWVTSVAFSPDGARVLSGSADKTIKLWDAATGALLRTFEGHSNAVTSVAFSPDGARVLSGSVRQDHQAVGRGHGRAAALAAFGAHAARSGAARGTSNYGVSRNGLTFSLGTRRSAPRRRPRSPTR